VRSAQHEQSELRAAIAKCPKGWMININSAATILAIADHVLAGEIAYRQGRMEESIAELRKGVELEDTLLYMEPPDWIQPVRHTLGAVLVDADRFAEAEKVYREDLRSWPENGWSLHGLAVCLKARGANAEATEVEQRFAKTWSRADTKPTSSCMCVKGKRGVVAMVEMKNEK
jgi:tetratricopeptide (TPR) repeat protein